MVQVEGVTYEGAKQEKARRSMKKDFRSFFKATEPSKPYYYGRHTKAILEELHNALAGVEAGESRTNCCTRRLTAARERRCAKGE